MAARSNPSPLSGAERNEIWLLRGVLMLLGPEPRDDWVGGVHQGSGPPLQGCQPRHLILLP
ncbi:hypothetical protein E2C01_082568 [Portunus trituberculatus]|uniref:Uncharacterized protein n=1 Tax=Portunus trituberculatus TaxID=210409 RepID=A0A5B7J177_PORTR|nr:hypothetical protein [Portunus trituberculatus]